MFEVVILFFKFIMMCWVVFRLMFFIVFNNLLLLELIILYSLEGDKVDRIICVVLLLMFDMEISNKNNFCFCLVENL